MMYDLFSVIIKEKEEDEESIFYSAYVQKEVKNEENEYSQL